MHHGKFSSPVSNGDRSHDNIKTKNFTPLTFSVEDNKPNKKIGSGPLLQYKFAGSCPPVPTTLAPSSASSSTETNTSPSSTPGTPLIDSDSDDSLCLDEDIRTGDLMRLDSDKSADSCSSMPLSTSSIVRSSSGVLRNELQIHSQEHPPPQLETGYSYGCSQESPKVERVMSMVKTELGPALKGLGSSKLTFNSCQPDDELTPPHITSEFPEVLPHDVVPTGSTNQSPNRLRTLVKSDSLSSLPPLPGFDSQIADEKVVLVNSLEINPMLASTGGLASSGGFASTGGLVSTNGLASSSGLASTSTLASTCGLVSHTNASSSSGREITSSPSKPPAPGPLVRLSHRTTRKRSSPHGGKFDPRTSSSTRQRLHQPSTPHRYMSESDSIGDEELSNIKFGITSQIWVRQDLIDHMRGDPVPTCTAFIIKLKVSDISSVIPTGADGGLPCLVKVTAKRNGLNFFQNSRIEYIFQGDEEHEIPEERYDENLFEFGYMAQNSSSNYFPVTLSRQQTTLHTCTRITPHLGTSIAANPTKKQKRRKKNSDLEKFRVEFRIYQDFGEKGKVKLNSTPHHRLSLLGETSLDFSVSPRSTWEKQRAKKNTKKGKNKARR